MSRASERERERGNERTKGKASVKEIVSGRGKACSKKRRKLGEKKTQQEENGGGE